MPLSKRCEGGGNDDDKECRYSGLLSQNETKRHPVSCLNAICKLLTVICNLLHFTFYILHLSSFIWAKHHGVNVITKILN